MDWDYLTSSSTRAIGGNERRTNDPQSPNPNIMEVGSHPEKADYTIIYTSDDGEPATYVR
jgi:hypothetical protein